MYLFKQSREYPLCNDYMILNFKDKYAVTAMSKGGEDHGIFPAALQLVDKDQIVTEVFCPPKTITQTYQLNGQYLHLWINGREVVWTRLPQSRIPENVLHIFDLGKQYLHKRMRQASVAY
ncbi:hypothetical protein SAMN02745181_0342 [Rubritalea squalenifaciens DSM 18772]|uniref:Uncharacterized protein n=1 Tax=Rubritalea squalenifaciens DSM 18772 TaxID=1123071 RepID=A0A1M6BYJ2_9BACT|nr:hypothetical protein [Rubritalea squalenifaciens]SHI53810.1 hypothetical protein SAMN02745181_0342 [Rubritalea squalenifaciens DSM 18772]